MPKGQLRRPGTVALLDRAALGEAPRQWADVPAPRPHGRDRHDPGSVEYAAKWQALAHAAEAIGWGPDDVARRGVTALNGHRVTAGHARWAPRTVAYYTKLARYAGLNADHIEIHDQTLDLDRTQARELWQPDLDRHHPSGWRSAAIARLAWDWPAPVTTWLTLNADSVRIIGADALTITATVDDEPAHRLITGSDAVTAWAAWMHARSPLATATSPAICATEAGPHGARPGAAMSLRGLQAAFSRHARTRGLPELTYDRYRAAAVAAGSAPVGQRGAERARRRTTTSSR